MIPGALALAALLAVADPLPPREQEAARLFEAAAAAYARGDFVAAARAFEQAHLLAPRAATIYNAGLAWERGGELARAADGLQAALALDGLSPAKRSDAAARLRVLRQGLGILVVTGPAGAAISIAHVEGAAPPLELHLAPGVHRVSLRRADGAEEVRTAEIRAGQAATLAFPERAAPPAFAAPAPAETAAAPPPAPAPTWMRPAAWGALATAVLLGGAAVYLGVEALNARDDFARSGYTDRAARSRAASLRTWTNAALGGAATLGAGGVVLFALSGSF